ncbi:MAG: 6,7-dimethyl-8-ribityllumazine synthase [Dysgonamonadaceae bacterium]|jgi:6,7-dimethyl-8-ribityllumazine synthase|nr:6,7-dimethyl-8-ribityllumazine synthase [Dysgonamonadaceae bacterium]
MATELQNLSVYDSETVPDAGNMRFAVIVSEWNPEITGKLREGTCNTLLRHGAKPENITVVYVPGSFELVYAAKRVVGSIRPDAVIGLGCVIRGETPHFDYVCAGVTQGFSALNAEGDIPYIFGLLTTNNLQEALDRAGGKHGNKGDECAVTAIKMINYRLRFTHYAAHLRNS